MEPPWFFLLGWVILKRQMFNTLVKAHMSINPAAQRIISRYKKLAPHNRHTFFRAPLPYNDRRCVSGLISWATTELDEPFLTQLLKDAQKANNTERTQHILGRMFEQRRHMTDQHSAFFLRWVPGSSFDVNAACTRVVGEANLLWIDRLLPYVEDAGVRAKAYEAIVLHCEFCRNRYVVEGDHRGFDEDVYINILIGHLNKEPYADALKILAHLHPIDPVVAAVGARMEGERLRQEIAQDPIATQPRRKL